MKINVTDIFHLYLGSRARYTYDDGTVVEFIIDNIYTFGAIIFAQNLLWNEDDPFTSPVIDIEIYLNEGDNNYLQLFLIRPEALTDEQKVEYKKLCHKVKYNDATPIIEFETDTPESLLWMLRNRVDCFGLIDRGQAIDMLPPSQSLKVIEKPNKTPLMERDKRGRIVAYLL